ncbi:MAG: class I SAM-dependent methyltransferase [Actinobacteria bacterium]|nr:class I SAM-dependent methyltransferase [Actinomycetota bacterium]
MTVDHKELVRMQFGAQAGEYAKGCFIGDETLDLILRFIEPRPDDEALDVATGAGFTAAALAPHVKEVVAVDITEEMLEQAEALFKERELRNALIDVADAEDLPYADEVFDVVTCRIAAHHFPRARRALEQMVRVLKPGGRLVVADSSAPADRRVDVFLNEIEKMRDQAHVRNYGEAEWRSLLTDCGTEVEQVAAGTFEIDFDEWTHRAAVPDRTKRQIRKMLLGAPAEIKEAVKVREEGGKLFFTNFWLVIGARKRC